MDYVWKKKLKLGTALYLLARYTSLIIVAVDVPFLFANVSVQVRFVSILKSLEWHYLNVVSSNTTLEVQLLCHVRTCNSIGYFLEALSFLPIIGVQGNNGQSFQCWLVYNFLLCRPFASASLCYCRTQKTGFSRSWDSWGLHRYTIHGLFSCVSCWSLCDGHLYQPVVIVSGCNLSSSTFSTISKWAWSPLATGLIHWCRMKPCRRCIRCKTGQMFIDTLIDLLSSVISAQTFATILFDTVVVAVTIASTLGPWRLHQRSTWKTMSFAHLLVQQSKWCLPFHVNSDDRNSRSDEIRVFLHWSLASKNDWSPSDLSWQSLLLPRLLAWYCRFRFYNLLVLTRCTRLWEWVMSWALAPLPFNLRISQLCKTFLGICRTGES